jgi:hypothetical protein
MSDTIKFGLTDAKAEIMAALEDRLIHPLVHPLTVDNAMRAAVDYVRRKECDFIYKWIYPKIDVAVETYVLMNGAYNPGDRLYKKDTWTEGMDDVIANVFEEYAGQLSASWLGEMVVDTRMYEENAKEKLANSFASEIWKNITWLQDKDHGGPKTDAQILSSVGVLRTDIEAFIETRNTPQAKQEQEQLAMNSLETAIPRIKGFVELCGYDDKALTQILDNALDSDINLAQGGLTQIGAGMDDREALLLGAMMYGADGLIKMIRSGTTPQDGTSETAPIATQVTTTKPLPPAPAAAARNKKTADVPQVGQLPAEALALLKEFTSYKVEKLGEGLGVSRASYENYVKGKAKFYAKPEHATFLMGVINEHKAALAKAEQLIKASQPPQ